MNLHTCPRRSHRVPSSIVVALLAIWGCNVNSRTPPTVPVSGVVTMAGKPIPSGRIILRPLNGEQPPVSGTITDGSFSLESPLGEMKVEVYSTVVDETKMTDMGPTVRDLVPQKYNVDSQLRMTVVAEGPNHYEFHLENTEKPKPIPRGPEFKNE